MKAPEVPPLLVRASDQSPEKIAGRLSKFSRWSEIGAHPWVMRIVQWGYKIPFVTLPPLRLQEHETTYPKGSLSGRLWTRQCKSGGTRKRSSQLHSPQAFTTACSLFAKPRDTSGSSRANTLCWKLGLVLNLEKSDLIPSQVATYLGIELDTLVGLARPSHKRVTNWLSVAQGFTAQQSPPAVQWLQVLGHLVSLEKLVPYGRIRIRPIQWQLRLHWAQSREKSSKPIPLDLQYRLAIIWWTKGTI